MTIDDRFDKAVKLQMQFYKEQNEFVERLLVTVAKEKLAQDPTVLKRFDESDSILQNLVITNLSTVEGVKALFDLVDKNGLKGEDIVYWGESAHDDVSGYWTNPNQHKEPGSREFHNEAKLLASQYFEPSGSRLASDRLARIVLHLLLLEHSEETVLEVMNFWRENRVSWKIDSFVSLVENWNELRSYPVDWILNFVKPSKPNDESATD